MRHRFPLIKDTEELKPITEKIIGCAFKVSNTLGSGFLEKVYENALAYELKKTGLQVSQQQPIQVWYEEMVIGDYTADLLIEEKVLVELKAVKVLDEVHTAQCIHYLKATGLRLCLLINFGNPKVEVKRLVV